MAKLQFLSNKPLRIDLEEGQWIEITDSLPLDEYKIITKEFSETDSDKNIEGSRKLVKNYLLAWSLLDENGQPLPCTPENIDKLSGKTILELSDILVKMYLPEKKSLKGSDQTSLEKGKTKTA